MERISGNMIGGFRGSRISWELIQTIFLYSVFICYILFLIKMLFLSRISLADLLDGPRAVSQSVNLVPFDSIKGYIFSSSADIKRFAFGNVVGNIIAFIPLGAYLSLFSKYKGILTNLLLVFSMSLCTEVIQVLWGIGTADVDDIILNCLGGLAGVLGYKILSVLLVNEKNIRAAFTILSVFGLPVLLYLLFVIKMRF